MVVDESVGEQDRDRTREAGAIAVRIEAGEAVYLLVTAKGDPKEWIFPKGHVERGETLVDAARRELLEEAGVEGQARGEVGRSRFSVGASEFEVLYFLFMRQAERDSTEGRRKAWLPYTAAHERLSFADARLLLARARQMITEER